MSIGASSRRDSRLISPFTRRQEKRDDTAPRFSRRVVARFREEKFGTQRRVFADTHFYANETERRGTMKTSASSQVRRSQKTWK